MKPKENFQRLLIVKESDNPEENIKIFPLGYTDKREVKRKKGSMEENLGIRVNQVVVNHRRNKRRFRRRR